VRIGSEVKRLEIIKVPPPLNGKTEVSLELVDELGLFGESRGAQGKFTPPKSAVLETSPWTMLFEVERAITEAAI
jgi:hypothetical protein